MKTIRSPLWFGKPLTEARLKVPRTTRDRLKTTLAGTTVRGACSDENTREHVGDSGMAQWLEHRTRD